MIRLHNLKPRPGSKHRVKRLGCGESSAPSANVFSDFQEPAALVLFEVEKEYLPLDRHFFGGNRIGAHSFTRILIHHIQTTAAVSLPHQTRVDVIEARLS